MSTTTRRFVAGPLTGRVSIRKDPRSGAVHVDDIVSDTGKVIVSGGPVTGGIKYRVLKPRRHKSEFKSSLLDELVRQMKLPS